MTLKMRDWIKKKFGVMGWPVQHSLSPAMHEAAFAALDINACYLLLATPPAEVTATLRRLPGEGFSGWNVTVPHKETVSKCMDHLDRGAALASSVNTVVVDQKSHRLTGYSTDGYGLEMAVREHFDFDPAGNRLAFIGGGGAACATVVHMAIRGAEQILLINRTLSRIERIAAIIGQAAPGCQVNCLEPADRTAITRALDSMPLLVQATSLGLRPDDPLPLPLEVIPPETAVMDMIYGETPFLRSLRQEKRQVADGTAMLLYQGARSFTLWTGLEAPLEAMRTALLKALGQREKK